MKSAIFILRVLSCVICLALLVPVSESSAKKAETYKEKERRDHDRDNKLKTKKLEKDKKFWRYTDKKKDLQRDLKPNEHLAPQRPGRPPGPKEAKERYGLKKEPKYRGDVIEKKGTPVKEGKVTAGKPGYNEVIPQKGTPKKQIYSVKKIEKKP